MSVEVRRCRRRLEAVNALIAVFQFRSDARDGLIRPGRTKLLQLLQQYHSTLADKVIWLVVVNEKEVRYNVTSISYEMRVRLPWAGYFN